jgi:hypothetical protein
MNLPTSIEPCANRYPTLFVTVAWTLLHPQLSAATNMGTCLVARHVQYPRPFLRLMQIQSCKPASTNLMHAVRFVHLHVTSTAPVVIYRKVYAKERTFTIEHYASLVISTLHDQDYHVNQDSRQRSCIRGL